MRDRRWRAWRFGIVFAACSTLVACQPPSHPRSPELAPDGVTFRYRAPAARVVQLAGSWDDNTFLLGREWSRDTRVGLMQGPDHDGVWELRVVLHPGRYQYLFLVDGRFWQNDPSNPQRVPDGAGGSRSLLVVP